MVKPGRKRVTIKQVAQEAGVSTQTVSRVLNNRPDVAPETRRHILEIMDRLNYQPSALARSLIRRRSYTLGVVTAGLRYIGPSLTLNGIAKQAEEMGYSLLLKELPRFDLDDVEPILNALLARQVDGIIWAVAEVGNNRTWLSSRLSHLPVPVVFLTMHAQPNLSVVSFDNHAGGRLATEHLLAQGYRRIGHITGPLSWWEAQQRKKGWEAALSDAGYQVTGRQWAAGNWSPESGRQAITRLFDQYPEMDAVFVANDQMALGVLQVACRRGLNVPRQLAVVGFDDIPEAAYFCPPLTTIRHNLPELGYTAVKQVVRMVEAVHTADGFYRPETIWLKPQLVVRESSVAG